VPAATVRSTCPAALTSAVRAAVQLGGPPPDVATRVAGVLSRRLPGPAQLLTAAQLAGDPAGYQTHPVHVEPGGSFSIAVMVWRPGQVTPVHDHVSWCVTGVLAGTEYEEIFGPGPGRGPGGGPGRGPGAGSLVAVARRQNPPGTVAGFAPPGDIHRVRNSGTGVAVSMHVYGADLALLGSSIRRVYELPADVPAPSR
jgi:predicted metal-dependent enzyme (double-stranded beta helix superfamily)